MKLTIDDVARLSGFSRATVSRVIAGSDKVKDSTKQAILDVIRKNNYVASAMEREKGHKRPVAIIVGDLVDTETSFQLFHPRIIKTICQRMSEAGHDCFLYNSDYNVEKEDECLNRCLDLDVAGIFLLSATGTSSCLQQVVAKVPVVTINRDTNTLFTDEVLLDEFKCAYLAVKHLYELGHRNIGLVKEPKQIPLSYETGRGYQATCSELNLKEHIFQCNGAYEDGYALGRTLLMQKSNITGLFCVNYDIASGIETAYREAGRSVPEDLSIVIFQYVYEEAQKKKNIYTSVGAYNLTDIANAAADTMLQRLQETVKTGSRRLSVIMDTYLIPGKSTSKRL